MAPARPPPWRELCRVKQHSVGSVSPHAWQLPVLLNLWLTVLATLLVTAIYMRHGNTSLGIFTAAVLSVLVCPLSLVWVKLAAQHCTTSSDNQRKPPSQLPSLASVTNHLPPPLKSSFECCGVLFNQRSQTAIIVLCPSGKDSSPRCKVIKTVVSVLVILTVLFLLLLLAGDVERNPGPIDAPPTLVTEDKVDELAALLHAAAANWYLVLGQLGVSSDTRDQVRAEAAGLPDSSQYCLARGLHHWINSDVEPTYEKIVDVLRSDFIRNVPLAEQVHEFAARCKGKNGRDVLDPEKPLPKLVRGKVIGYGAYGSVCEMHNESGDVVCAGKFFHPNMTRVDKYFKTKFEKETSILSSLKHPNVVRYLGMLSQPEYEDYCLLMELMHCPFHRYILHSSIHISVKVSLLLDVAQGLSYLHSRSPAVIHRDITASNVLLTAGYPPVAKIADFGHCRIIDFESSSQVKSLTEIPGTLYYMAPEACEENAKYNTKLDIFSLGHLALFTFVQTNITDLLRVKEKGADGLYFVRTEVDRRQPYFDRLDLDSSHPVVAMTKDCLSDEPENRPCASSLVQSLERLSKSSKEHYRYNYDKSYLGYIFFGEPLGQSVSSRGGVLSWPTYGVRIHVPPNSFQGSTVKITVRPCVDGPFNLPDGYRLASPLFLITSSAKFDKAVELHMDHYMELKTKEHCQRMKFATFDCQNKRAVKMDICEGGRFKIDDYGHIKCSHFSIKAIVFRTLASMVPSKSKLSAKFKASFVTTHFSETANGTKRFKAIFFMYVEHVWIRTMVKDVLNQKYDNCLVWEEEAAPQRVKFGPRGFSEVDAEDFNRRLLEARGCTGAFDIREPTIAEDTVLHHRSGDYPPMINCSIILPQQLNSRWWRESRDVYFCLSGITQFKSDKRLHFVVKFCPQKGNMRVQEKKWLLWFLCWVLLPIICYVLAYCIYHYIYSRPSFSSSYDEWHS